MRRAYSGRTSPIQLKKSHADVLLEGHDNRRAIRA
jgi:hypothetical protein